MLTQQTASAQARRKAVLIALGLVGSVVCSVPAGATTPVAAGSWTANGPEGVIVYSLAEAPDRPAVLFASTHVGMLRSEDAGLSWSVVDTDLSGFRALEVSNGHDPL